MLNSASELKKKIFYEGRKSSEWLNNKRYALVLAELCLEQYLDSSNVSSIINYYISGSKLLLRLHNFFESPESTKQNNFILHKNKTCTPEEK